MGKTAVFRNVTQSHFRECETAFVAWAKWGCVLVAFAARDFSGGGEDKDDHAWVFDAVRATLSSEGVTFASTALLERFLESGTIGVAIDGLDEVERTKGIAAFTWRLPSDIRQVTSDLLQRYLTSEQAELIMQRITASGLRDAVRSGYDVRLVIDLVRYDVLHAQLPADRMGLYAAIVEGAWPDVPDDARREQQSLTAAAAWRSVSERKPNEDMRRLKPETDLSSILLTALADAPDNDNRSVRLVRRVGAGAFEFVHEQMHFYLAARWFAQDGRSVAELEKMVAGSTIWIQSTDARRTMWEFAAGMLEDKRLQQLRARVEDNEEWDILRRALKAEAERRGLHATEGTFAETR
jgi:hypothetical protein